MSETYVSLNEGTITPVALPPEQLRGIEATVATDHGFDRVVISPNTWAVDRDRDPDVAAALGAIGVLAGHIIQSNVLYEGSSILNFGGADAPSAIAFASATLSRRELEGTRDAVVEEVNALLGKVQSPYRL